MKRSDNKKQNISDTLANICSDSEALIVGLTGGIASGKSTVAEMFCSKGAVIIDFDILARNVVEPGRKSWQLIIEYFGNNIVNHDSTINRKKLSGIVFNDRFKREKLESFTHPFIWDEFMLRVQTSVQQDRHVIIHAVIPLLIESNMHDLFIKNIIIYLSPEKQIQRLMARDGINRQMADKILMSQMPIDDKVKYCDFIIKNEGSIEDTEQKVNEVWKRLKKIQENKNAEY